MKQESHTAPSASGNLGNSSQLDGDGSGNVARSAVAREYQAFLDDVEHLITSASSMTAEEIARAKARLGSYISSAKSSVSRAGGAIVDNARNGARATDRYVREQPWQAVGITAVAGLLVGYLLGRQKP
jgi:ElaB/YqjD/DUF883 family membrane-anchored ribosome-binding protein